MAFTEAHKKHIEAYIGHLIDFPTSAEEFKKEVAQLSAVFNGNNSNEEFTLLHNCLKNPEQHFHRLEKQCASDQIDYITMAEVKECVITLITENLTNAARNLQIEVSTLDWNPQLIRQKFIFAEDAGTQFESEPLIIPDTSSYWEMPSTEGKIYKVEIKNVKKEQRILPSRSLETLDETEEIHSHDEREEIHSISEEDDSEREIEGYPEDEDLTTPFNSEAESESETNSDLHLYSTQFSHLNLRDLLNAEQTEEEYQLFLHITITYTSDNVVTIKQHLEDKPLSFNSNEEENNFKEDTILKATRLAEELVAKAAIDYLAKKIVIAPFIVMTALGSFGFQKIVTTQYYFAQFCTGEIAIKDFVRYSKEEAENLTNPHFIFLFKNKLCKIAEIISLPPHVIKVALHPVYYQLLKTGKIKIADIAQLKRKRELLLLKPSYARKLCTAVN